MQIKPEQLGRSLAERLTPVYIVSGDEPLLMDEARGQIVGAAREAGFTERVRLDVGRGFDWAEFAEATRSRSLFGDRRLVELRVGSGKLGEKGDLALCEFAAAPTDVLLLVTGGRFDRAVFNSAWYRALAEIGTAMPVSSMKQGDLEHWVRRSGERKGLEIGGDAAQLLAQLCEGNSLAVAQALELLALRFEPGDAVDAARLAGVVVGSSRYSAFDLLKALTQRDATRWTAILESLAQCGAEPLQVLGALMWQLRRERHPVGAMHEERLARLLSGAQRVESCAKGLEPGSVWMALFDFCLEWRGQAPLEVAA